MRLRKLWIQLLPAIRKGDDATTRRILDDFFEQYSIRYYSDGMRITVKTDPAYFVSRVEVFTTLAILLSGVEDVDFVIEL